jgi:HAD superfamily hydrolase (TIGR01509 family)
MTIHGVLWDMDGVLIDTGELHFLAWSATLDSFHIPFSYELFLEGFGMNNRDMLKNLLGHDPDPVFFAQICTQKETAFLQMIPGRVKLLPGVRETLRYLASKNIRQAIASSAPMENIDALVDELDLRLCFHRMISGYDIPGKPAPDVFLASARAIGVSPSECLVIEDSVTGVEGAKRAGMACLAVTNTNPAAKLSKADYVIDSLFQLDDAFWEPLFA